MKCECGFEFKKLPKAKVVERYWCVFCPKCKKKYVLWEDK